MYSKSMITAIAATLFASANAHFFIKSPSPIPGSAIKDPLDASGANFPCHGADVSSGSVTQMSVGSDIPLQFELGGGANTAVHGGGSCQISLSYETDAAKLKDPASWKVIQSFIGGCPTDAKGNLDTAKMCDGSNSPNCVNNLSFKIPSEVQNGNAIMAWTWFNNVGNREMYMNCAKVSLSGGQNQLSSLPSMLVANLASINQCTTSESFNTDFPNPGKYVTKEATLNFPLKVAQGSGCGSGSGSGSVPSTGGTGSTGSGSSGSSSAAGSGASSAAVPGASPASGSGSSAAAGTGSSATSSANNGQYTGIGAGSGASKSAPAGKPSSAAGKPGGVFAPGASPAASASAGTGAPAAAVPSATQIATTFVTSAAPAANTGAASPAAAAPSSGSGTCGAGEVACTASGFYCISQTTFGMCNFGCATPMQMADGTACNNGAVMHAVNHPRRRRSIRHFHKRHVAGSF